MKTLFTLIALSHLLATSVLYGQAWSYRGIPYVTDNVPDELMPTLPDPLTMVAGWPYDPCTIATPTFSDGATQYYVNSVSGNDGTAGNSGRGSVALPRQTLPNESGGTWTLGAGDQVFISDDSLFFPDGAVVRIESNGTLGSIAWIIGLGVDGPEFGNDQMNLHGQHLIIENVKITNNDGGMRVKIGNSNGLSFISYFTLRNSIVDGQGGGQNAAIGSGGYSEESRCSFICIYNNSIRELGDWDRADALGTDKHGIQPGGFTDHWWIIENDIFHCEGDSIQINSSSKHSATYTDRPHYIYIAGNELYENYENAHDVKTSFHVIFSENLVHGFHNAFKSANETAIIAPNDSEGTLSSYTWTIFNTIFDVGQGIKIAANAAETINGGATAQTAGQKAYAIGNLIHDAGTGIELDSRGTNSIGIDTWFEEVWVVNNTIQSSNRGTSQSRANDNVAEPTAISIIGNLIKNSGSVDEVEMLTNVDGQTFTVSYNVIDRVTGSVTQPVYDIDVGNIKDSDPLFVSEGTDNFQILTGSPAKDVSGFTAEPSPYATFLALYGIDIETDLLGLARPQNMIYDAGAYEFNSGSPPETGGDPYTGPVRLNAPTNLILDGSGTSLVLDQ